MEKILLRYGEIGLKSDYVRRGFENKLIENIRHALKGNNFSILRHRGRIFLDIENPNKTLPLLKRIFGIVSFSIIRETNANMRGISTSGLSIAKHYPKIKTFSVKTRRSGNHTFTSQQVNEKLGEVIRKKTKLRVNLSNPDLTVFVEVRDKKAYLFTDKIRGSGGLPLGTQGKTLALIENKRSIAAAWLIMKRGCNITPVLKKQNKTHLKLLQKWSIGYDLKPKIIRSFSKNQIENLLKKEKTNSIVVSSNEINYIKEFKNSLVLTPLISMSDREVKFLLKRIESE